MKKGTNKYGKLKKDEEDLKRREKSDKIETYV